MLITLDLAKGKDEAIQRWAEHGDKTTYPWNGSLLQDLLTYTMALDESAREIFKKPELHIREVRFTEPYVKVKLHVDDNVLKGSGVKEMTYVDIVEDLEILIPLKDKIGVDMLYVNHDTETFENCTLLVTVNTHINRFTDPEIVAVHTIGIPGTELYMRGEALVEDRDYIQGDDAPFLTHYRKAIVEELILFR